MADLNEAEVVLNEDVANPIEPVVGEEGGETPQTPTDAEEFEIDLGGEEQDSQDEGKVPLRKFKKLREKNNALKEQVKEKDVIAAELAQLRSEMAQLQAGPEPSFYDFDNEDDYRKAYGSWYSKKHGSSSGVMPQSNQQQSTSQQSGIPAVADEVFDSHYQRAEELETKHGIKGFFESEKTFRESLAEEFGEQGSAVADLIIANTGDKSHLIVHALGNSEAKRNKLINAMRADIKNGTLTARELLWQWKYEAKLAPAKRTVKTNPIDAPEARGNASSLENQIKKAAEEYAKNPNLENHARLRAARKAANTK